MSSNRLLRALMAYLDVTAEMLSLRSGVPRARIYAIRAGRASPSEREFNSLVEGLGRTRRGRAGLLTAAESHVLPAEMLDAICALSDTFAPSPNGSRAQLRIDRLSFTVEGDVVELRRSLAGGWAHVRSSGRRCLYVDTFKREGITVQLDPTDPKWTRQVRVDLVPSESAEKATRRVLRLCDPRKSHVSRIDIAVDVSCALGLVQPWPKSGAPSVVTWVHDSRRPSASTLYVGSKPLGSKRASSRLRVYNAALQHPHLSVPTTRFEYEWRQTNHKLQDLPTLRNPFDSMHFLSLEGGGNLTERLLRGYARLFGLQRLQVALSSKQFSSVLRSLKKTQLPVPSPAHVFREHYRNEALALLSRLLPSGSAHV